MQELTKQNLRDAKVAAIRAFPFLSFLVLTSKYGATTMVPTMAAYAPGGHPRIVINEDFFNGTLEEGNKLTTIKQRAFVICHELMHIFFQHLGRQVDHNYHHQLWNVATDFCINLTLHESNNDKIEFPSFGLLDTQYTGMSSDAIYHKLREELEKQGWDPNDKSCGGFGMPGDENAPFDEVSSESLSPEEKAQLKAQLATAMNQAKMMGTGKGDKLFDMLNDLLDPVVPWKDLLQDYVTRTTDYDRITYNKYNRRSGRVIFPSAYSDDHINILMGIDTSGSMSEDDLKEALTELKSIMDLYGGWEITLVSCDTGVDENGTYSKEQGDDITTIKPLSGGGGTDMNPIVEYAEELDEPPHVIIIVSDGYMPDFHGSYDIPSILVITKNGNHNYESDGCQIIHIN